MALRNIFRKKGSGGSEGEKPAAQDDAALCRSLNESPDIAEPQGAENLFTEQETTSKLGNKRKGRKQGQHPASIFII